MNSSYFSPTFKYFKPQFIDVTLRKKRGLKIKILEGNTSLNSCSDSKPQEEPPLNAALNMYYYAHGRKDHEHGHVLHITITTCK